MSCWRRWPEDYPEPEQQRDIEKVLEMILKEEIRRTILEESRRPDGRGPEDIRPLYSETSLLPRAHGSGLSGADRPRC